MEENGEPDLVEEDETHKKMVWLNGDVEVTLEFFSLMTHQGMRGNDFNVCRQKYWSAGKRP